MASTSAGGNCASWGALPPDLLGRCLSLLDPNERALYGRLVSKDACRRLNDPLHRTAAFSIPLPPEAAQPAWQQHIQQAFHQETFRSKFLSLSAAAASGSQRNVELAWVMLQPCVALIEDNSSARAEDAGSAAIRHGHLHLLPWLLQHGCPLSIERMLPAAAKHCDLAGLQRVWELLGGDSALWPHIVSDSYDLLAAIGGSGPEAIAKLVWLLPRVQRFLDDPEGASSNVLVAVAQGATASGKQPMLRWLLHERGRNLRARWTPLEASDVPSWCVVLGGALRHEHVAVADRLVDEADCALPKHVPPERLQQLWDQAARGGSVESMRWLLRRGVPMFPETMGNAARSGRLEAVRFLHQECGLPVLTETVFCEAAASGSVPLATWLLQAGCPMSESAYGSAAGGGQLGMIRWLMREAKCPWDEGTLREVMIEWCSRPGMTSFGAGSNRDLEPVVWAMLEAGCPPGDDTDEGDSIGAAARLGLLPLVRHLHEQRGVAFGPEALAMAAQGGCVPVVEWLVGAGCVAGEDGTDCYVFEDPYMTAGESAGIGDVATLSCLRRLGVPWQPDVLQLAVDEDVSLRVIRWMVEQGARWDRDALLGPVTQRLDWGMWEDETVLYFAGRLGF